MGPIFFEVVANEVAAVAVDFGDQFHRFLLGFSNGPQAADFFLGGRVDENVKRVGPIAQDVGRTTSDNHAIAAGGDVLDDGVQHLYHAVGIKIFGFSEGESAFVTAAGVGFKQPVEQSIDTFVAAPGDLRIHTRGAP